MEIFSREETPIAEIDRDLEQERISRELLLGQAAMELGY